ncbi:MAG TPA: hypothetical protein VFB04_13860 [Terriglobales bacterium]|nr:hypothetical protein [Terriglobales bacterium]
MPWNVQLEDEHGEAITRVLAVWGFFPEPDDKTFLLIQFLDPYGNTVFNRLQMPQFLEEWERLRDLAEKMSNLSAWTDVKRLAQQCASGVHLYLRFIGD